MHAERPRVLVVENDAATRTALANALQRGGFDVETAADGLVALKQLDSNRPDAMVLDPDLPVMNGFAVHATLLANERTRDLPVVVVKGTGLAGPTPVAATLVKPVNADELIHVLADAIARSTTSEAMRTISWLCPRCRRVSRETREPGDPMSSTMRTDDFPCAECRSA